MKIKLEGFFSNAAIEIDDCERNGQPLSKETQELIDLLKQKNSPEKISSNQPDMKEKFRSYVNRGRSPYSINSDGIFTGSIKVLTNFANSFEKKIPGVKVNIGQDYMEGEYVPVVRSVTYKKGEDK